MDSFDENMGDKPLEQSRAAYSTPLSYLGADQDEETLASTRNVGPSKDQKRAEV